jgi:hypothetical protein
MLWYVLLVKEFFLVEQEYSKTRPAKTNGKRKNLKINFNFKWGECL